MGSRMRPTNQGGLYTHSLPSRTGSRGKTWPNISLAVGGLMFFIRRPVMSCSTATPHRAVSASRSACNITVAAARAKSLGELTLGSWKRKRSHRILRPAPSVAPVITNLPLARSAASRGVGVARSSSSISASSSGRRAAARAASYLRPRRHMSFRSALAALDGEPSARRSSIAASAACSSAEPASIFGGAWSSSMTTLLVSRPRISLAVRSAVLDSVMASWRLLAGGFVSVGFRRSA
mmetsp:Transcript_9257/g.29644  ORF Transcript_9257/g.29644 Transcript_9257/m.29644 type:complete len:237 (+) Transcript_9257:361-1071(+)